MNQYDAISLGIMWDRLVSITNEIVEALVRTSFSTIVRENYDLACMLFDADGRSLAQGSFSQPVFIGTGPQTIRHMLDRFPPETLQPGDVIFTNDAWMGTGHLWDVNVVRPVFRGEVLVGFTLSISHLPDIGGRGLSAQNLDVYEEGLQIPICKLVRSGELDQNLIEIIRKNVRVNEQVIGDLMANVASTEVGARLLLEFMEEYGIDDLRPLSQAIIDQSEQAMRAQIRTIPHGEYRNRISVEAFEEPVNLVARVLVSGDHIHVDYSDTSLQLRAGINVPLCYTRAMTCYAIKCLTIPAIPNNEGSLRPVGISAPEGCILNAQPPAASAARLLVGHFVVPLLFGAFAEALRDRVQADPGMLNALNAVGTRRDGRGFSTLFFSSGGLGGMQGLDGQSATVAPANMKTMPAEVWEAVTHMTVVERRLRVDSGGPGQFRGGLGQRVVLRNDTGSPIHVAVLGSRTTFPAAGFAGGRPGSLRRYLINGQEVHPKGRYTLEPSDIIVVEDAGGGGFGDPQARERGSVQADVVAGFVSREAAAEVYGLTDASGAAN